MKKHQSASSASTPLRIQVGGTTCRANHRRVLSVPKPNCSNTPKVPGRGTPGSPKRLCFWGRIDCSLRSAKIKPPVPVLSYPEIIEIAAPGPVSALPKCMCTPTFSTWTDPKAPPQHVVQQCPRWKVNDESEKQKIHELFEGPVCSLACGGQGT